jgi:DNA polymerase-4
MAAAAQGTAVDRVVLHVDMDAFFAAVEALASPRLRGLPVVVGGTPGSRGVVATASYEARRFGIEPGMSLTEAESRCPDAVFLAGDPPKYVYYSLCMLKILRGFSPFVEPFSIDEAFVEITRQVPDLAAGSRIGAAIQKAIRDELGLSASIGIGPNKLIAKMASRVSKPHGNTVLDLEAFQRHFWPLEVSKLYGVGDKTAVALASIGVHTVGDLASAPRAILQRAFGVVGVQLKHMAAGSDETPLIPYYEGVAEKSMGHEHTLARNESNPARLEAVLLRLSEQVARRLRLAGKRGRRVVVKLRFADFRTITRQRTLVTPTDEERTIYPLARSLMRANYAGRPLRLVGVSVADLVRDPGLESLFTADRRHREVLGAVDGLRDRFGENVLTRAKVMTARANPAEPPPESVQALRARRGRIDDRRPLRS